MTMKHCLITCSLMMMIQCYSGNIAAPSFLPAPINAKVLSTNFHNILTWDPGPGTPPGTQYIVHCRKMHNNNLMKPFEPTSSTSMKLKLKHSRTYGLSVQARLNMSMSPESELYTFCPVTDTIISPPMLSVAGCGTCIELNISMPKADKNSIPDDDIQKLYGFQFRIYCRKESEIKMTMQDTPQTSYRVENLDAGVEYCIKVEPMITVNKHSSPSEWKCDYTSRLEPSRGPVLVSSLAFVLLVGGSVLVLLFWCLYYTGFLCRLQHLPAILLQSPLIHRYVLTPERTIPDSVSILSDPEQQMMANDRRTLRPNIELEEEDDGEALYIQSGRATVGGAAELSSGATSGSDSGSQNTSGPGVPAAAAISRGCGSLRGVVELVAEAAEPGAEPGGHGQITESKGGRATVLYSEADLDQTAIPGHVGKAIEEEEEMREEGEQKGGDNSSGHDVNLFAVTLGSHKGDDVSLFSLTLGSHEEDEEEYDEAQSAKDFLRLCDDEQPLLPTGSPPRTSGDTGAQMEETLSVDGTLKAGLAETDPQNGHVDGHAGATETNSETEEEEEFSGYVGR